MLPTCYLEEANELNLECLQKLPSEETIISSIDTTINEDDTLRYPPEYINSLQASGMPPHRLCLKKGCIVMLLRNLNTKEGLCNGTRLIVDRIMNERLLLCIVANGKRKGNTVFIPKIMMTPTDENDGFEWRRLQFPVKLSFAMTINKSQGQTLKNVAVWLKKSVFSHGQLYVASSRVGDPRHIRFYVKPIEDMPHCVTRNVVYEELLL